MTSGPSVHLLILRGLLDEDQITPYVLSQRDIKAYLDRVWQ
jgi:hypothetical protein